MKIWIDERKLWEEAREWAAAEVLAKHQDELAEAQQKHFVRLTQSAQTVVVVDAPEGN